MSGMFANRPKSMGKFLLPMSNSYSSSRKPLSFHAVSFGPDASASTLPTMVDLAVGIQNAGPYDPLRLAAETVSSYFTTALLVDSVSARVPGIDVLQIKPTDARYGSRKHS